MMTIRRTGTTTRKKTPPVNITILVDNHAVNGLATEHGLCLWVETPDTRIFFDTGGGAAIENNTGELNINPGTAEFLVLSHGHSDHTGGVPFIVQQNREIRVYGHPGASRPRYSAREKIAHPIHMPREAMAAIDKLPRKNVHWVQHPVLLTDTIGITGPIPRETSFEDTGGPFFLDPEGHRPDPIEDDIALWIRTDKGVVVCVGCCHSGIVNTLNLVRRLNNGLRIRAVIGGFHLVNASQDRLDRTASALDSFNPDSIVPCHCTGGSAALFLKNALGDRVSPGMAGQTYRF